MARDAAAPRASGTLGSHYAPRTPAGLVAKDALRAELSQLEGRDERVAVLAWSVERRRMVSTAYGLARRATPSAYGHALYANLRALDAANADTILIEQVPEDNAWTAIRDRLVRATSDEHDDRD